MALALVVIALAGAFWSRARFFGHAPAAAGAAAPGVTVSLPLRQELETRLGFLGQFSALDEVDLRAQVGGTLTAIHFKDGDVVHKGDLLFAIDPVPYEIKLAQASAQLESATARMDLANREFVRAQELRRTEAGSVENVEQRAAEQHAAQAAVDAAKALIRDAQFDLDHCRITAPFTGRIGTHFVSVGNLIAGSRAASSPTTLLATIVSLDPIYLNFDMSESDYFAFARDRLKRKGPLADRIEFELGDEGEFSRQGTLDFVDNRLDRSSGTIHARATVPNADLLLTPGAFARVRLALGAPVATLLVPDAAVLADQSEHIVLTLGPDNVVIPKPVQLGDIRGNLRVIRSGLTATDQVIVDGLPYAAPGSKVTPHKSDVRTSTDQAGL
jgi:membrane fusion protein, multidrug efflux system